MKNYLVTYYNETTGAFRSVIVKASSLESAIESETEAVKMFARVIPGLRLDSVKAVR